MINFAMYFKMEINEIKYQNFPYKIQYQYTLCRP